MMKNGFKRTSAAILAALILASTGAATVAMTGVGASVVSAATVTTSDAVTNAVSAEKLRNDYTPNWYSIDLSGTTITAVYTSTGLGDGTNLMNDVARLLGTIYEKGKENFNATSSIKTITFNNVEYTWKTEDIGGQSVLEGSNWRDASNNTLVSALVTYYGQHSGTDSVVLKINDTDYTFAVKVGVAKIGTTTYDTLEAAVTAASSGATIELQSDITLTNTTLHIMKDLTIDLNGHDITAAARALWVKSGTLTLTGNGIVSSSLNDKESSVIRVGNNDSNTYEQNQASQIAAGLVVGKNVTVSGPGCYGVTAFGSLTQETVEISGKVSGLSGFGTNGNDKYNAAKLTLTSTGVIESTATDGSATSDSAGYAMYLPAPGKYEINGTVTGYGGICIKSGQCDISIGSTAIIKATGTAGYAGAAKSVTGTGDKDGSTWYTNGNGPATAGYAIAVENNAAYAGGTTVKIAGGSITGALTIYDDYGGDAKGTTLSNKGTITITGGTFSTDPTAFVNTSSYKVTGGGPYTVSKIVYSAPTTTTTPTVTTNEDGSTTTTTTKTENGATVTTATDKDANGNVTGSTETKEEKKSDGSTVTTETKKDADGKVTQTTETTVAKDTTTNTTTETSKTENADGTKTTETVKKVDENNKVLSETTKETEVDKEAEQQTEVLTEKKEDGSVVKTTTTSSTKEGDLSKTIVEEKAAENSRGSTVEQTTTTVIDTTGKTTSVTEEHKIDNVGNSTNATITIEKDGDGNVQEATAEVEKTGATKEDGLQATFTNKVVSQLKEAAGDAAQDLTITMTVKDENGDDHHSITAKVDDLTPNNTLYIYKQDENGNYVMVNAKEYTTDAKGQLKTTIKSKNDFVLLNEQEANAATKAVLSTVKASKTTASVKKSKTTTMKLDSGLNMANVKNITYKTSKSSVATVNKKTGKITAKKAGKATVSAVVTLKNGTKKTVKMTVNVK